MNNFGSNRAIRDDVINYVVLGKDDKPSNPSRMAPSSRCSSATCSAPVTRASRVHWPPTSVITKANMNSARSQQLLNPKID
jgi:hypothetical protein